MSSAVDDSESVPNAAVARAPPFAKAEVGQILHPRVQNGLDCPDARLKSRINFTYLSIVVIFCQFDSRSRCSVEPMFYPEEW